MIQAGSSARISQTTSGIWIFVGANRGGMRECYHGPCDIYDHKNQENNKINWKFLVQTTQTLIGMYGVATYIEIKIICCC